MDANTDQADVNALPHALQSAVLSLLSPRTLSACACVCRGWRELVAEQAWREALSALWSPPLAAAAAAATESHAWQLSYASRQDTARCWLGRPSTDKLVAHRTAVKACCLLPGHDLLFTGGVDRTVRAWDLQGGVQLACSRRHGGTVRCVAADSTLLASGSSDHAIRVWGASSSSSSSAGNDPSGIGGSIGGSSGGSLGSSLSSSSSSGGGLPFDLAGDRAVLEGHAGPVSCLQLTPSLIVSGSWDCSVRLWDRATLECVGMVHTDDWVSSLAVKGGLLAAACGASVLLFRLEGSALRRLGSLACPSLGGGGADVAAAVTAVDCTADGRNVFMGTADGGVWLADVPAACTAEPSGGSGGSSGGGGALASGHQRPVLLQRQPAEVAGLSWDHPWLAVADRAGNVLLLDTGTCTAAGAAAVEGSRGAAAAAGRRAKKQLALTSRVLFSASMGGAGAAAQCVCLDGTWAAAGLDCGTALSFDGSKGQQQLAAAAAARQQKAERRQRNLERQQQQQQRGGKGGGSAGSTKRSQPLPIPPRAAQNRQGDQQQQSEQEQQHASPSQQQQQTQDQPDGQQPPLSSSRGRSLLGRSPSARVPPPLPREALAAASSCRQQVWHVLRAARSAAGGEGSSASPAPQP